MIDFEALSQKNISDFTDDEKTALRDAYLQYFDKLNVRMRAIGYCVIYGGVPSHRIGEIMVNFSRFHNISTEKDEVSVSLTFGPFPLVYDPIKDAKFGEIIREYMLSEARFAAPYHGDGVGWDYPLKMPLFIATKKSRYGDGAGGPLRNVQQLLHKAGMSFGFSARKIKLYLLGNGFKFTESFIWKSGSGFVFKETPITQFSFKRN